MARSTTWVFGFKVVSSAALSAFAVLAARQLGPSGRGALALIVTITSLSVLLTSLGVQLAARVHLVSPDRPVPLSHCLGLMAMLVAVAAWLPVAVAGVALPLAGVKLGAVDLVLISVYGAALLTSTYVLDLHNAFGLNTQAAVLDMLGSIVQLSGAVGLAVAGSPGVRWFVLAVGASLAFQSVVSLAHLSRQGLLPRPRMSAASSAELLRTGLPGLGFVLSQNSVFRLDRYITGLLLTPAAVGFYSVAATAVEFLRLPGAAFAQVLFYRLASGRAAAPDMATPRRKMLAIVTVGGVGLFALAPWIVELLFGPRYAPAVTPLRILVLAEILVASFLIDAPTVLALGRVALGSVPALAGLVVLVLADLVLIPRLGVAGAAWASVGAYLVMAFTARVCVRRL